MSEDSNETKRPDPPRKSNEPEVFFPIPRNMVYGTVAVVIASLLVTFFVRNPYTQSVSESSLYYERSMETNMALWVAIFIGIPASFLAYKHWILPFFERRMKNQRR